MHLIGCFLTLIFIFSPISTWAYTSLDQGYAPDRLVILSCGSACIGAPEIQGFLDSGLEIQRSGVYVEQGDESDPEYAAPWANSRTKWLRKLGRSIHRENTRYIAAAFSIGVGIQDQERSATSSIWREIRKPLLYDLRNRIVNNYKERQKNKVKAWALEQTLDIGASAIGLDSYGYVSDVLDSDDLVDRRSSVITKFKPRLDPYKGRYGAALQSKFFQGARDPFYFEVSYFYCNTEWGVGDRTCGFLHQARTTYGYRYRANQRNISFQLSVQWEARSLNADAYSFRTENGGREFFDFKPWGFQTRILIAI